MKPEIENIAFSSFKSNSSLNFMDCHFLISQCSRFGLSSWPVLTNSKVTHISINIDPRMRQYQKPYYYTRRFIKIYSTLILEGVIWGNLQPKERLRNYLHIRADITQPVIFKFK